jgi:hypothetical protein
MALERQNDWKERREKQENIENFYALMAFARRANSVH